MLPPICHSNSILPHSFISELNLELIEVLSSSLASSVDLILPQSPFVNLKYLKIYPEEIHQASKKVAMSTKLKSYLLDGSSGSTFTMVFREEIIAQELMADLPVYLERENKSSKIKRAHLDRGKTPVESHEPEKLKIWEDMALIKSGCENPGMQHNTRVIILKLQRIKELLTMLPASKRAKLQPCFSSLCAQADIVINQVTDSMKIHCDENQSVSSVCATTLEPSS
ncbi:hypothetical protein QVD17_04113 [Tagetes erecta]|uniref:Uncharacterized protein n=1 Tax=Tagetes erecta TaxID=13708 RepID=A0AAD8LFP7_TARER|nr:hypothetical protein QVD17_04113 [Tagetes erecta]